MQKLQPVIVITIYRRYHELRRCILRVRELEHEFQVKPKIVVVWAQPENGMEWLFNAVPIDLLIKREKLPLEGESGGTTYPESHNIRTGFELAISKWGEDIYFILQSVDIYVEPGVYGEFDAYMCNGGNLGIFHWQNNCVSTGAYHTNFFAVNARARDYWPPVSDPHNHDCLEWQWGKILGNYSRPPQTAPKDYRFQLFNLSYFKHHHTDYLTNLPASYSIELTSTGKALADNSINLFLSGRKVTWYGRIFAKVKKFIRDEKSAPVTTCYEAWLLLCNY